MPVKSHVVLSTLCVVNVLNKEDNIVEKKHYLLSWLPSLTEGLACFL